MRAELREAIRQEEEVVRYIRNVLSPMELNELEDQIQSQLRFTATAVLLFFLFGFHLIYLKDFKGQLLFLLTLGGLGIWWLLEGWVLESRIKLFNLRLYRQHATQMMALKRADDPGDHGAQTIVIRRNR